MLQTLGTVRAGQSWMEKMKAEADKPLENKQLPKPAMEELRGQSVVLSFANFITLGSLLLEFIQLASFPLQAASDDDDDDDGSNPLPRWAPGVFKLLYGFFISNDDIVLIWLAIGCVAALILLFCRQFLLELRTYGLYLVHGKAAGDAKQTAARKYLFNTLTGAVVFGHGKARWVGWVSKGLVALLSDVLYLTVTFHLVQALVCDREGNLLSDSSITCWEGQHLCTAAAALTALTFYVCLSVMLAPMLAEDSPPNTITFVKAYAMFLVLVRTVMIVGSGFIGPVLGELSVAVATFISSLLMFCGTLLWIKHAMASGQGKVIWFPSGVSLVNWWKLSVFAAGMVSAAEVAALVGSGHKGGNLLEFFIPALAVLILLPFIVDYTHRWAIHQSIKTYFMGTGPWVRAVPGAVHSEGQDGTGLRPIENKLIVVRGK